MLKRLLSTAAIIVATPLAANAEGIAVATDILPVQSLVAMVTGDLSTPEVIVRPGASPHGYSMRPSEAQALESADVVFWIGEGLTPWLEDPIETLAGEAVHVELASLEGTTVFEMRSGAGFAEHDHDHGDEHGHDDGHEDEHDDGHAHNDDHAHDHAEDDDHKHDDDHAHDEEHAHGDDDAHEDHAHDHSGGDPHVWLSPDNALAWLPLIADTLAEADPRNANTYRTNAEAAADRIAETVAEATALLGKVTDRPFVVYHDAYQYFETTFGLSASGSLALSDATAPSAARIAEIQQVVTDGNIVCAFAEPQFDPGLVESVFGATETKVAVLDPVGLGEGELADAYPRLILTLATEIAECLS